MRVPTTKLSKKEFISLDDQLIFKDKETEMNNIEKNNQNLFKSLNTLGSVSLNDSDEIKLKSGNRIIQIEDRNILNSRLGISIKTIKNNKLFCDIPKALFEKYKAENINHNVDDVLDRQVLPIPEIPQQII